MSYTVTWSIELEDEDAATPEEAARLALDMQRDPESIALVFAVTGNDGAEVVVDLWQ